MPSLLTSVRRWVTMLAVFLTIYLSSGLEHVEINGNTPGVTIQPSIELETFAYVNGQEDFFSIVVEGVLNITIQPAIKGTMRTGDRSFTWTFLGGPPGTYYISVSTTTNTSASLRIISGLSHLGLTAPKSVHSRGARYILFSIADHFSDFYGVRVSANTTIQVLSATMQVVDTPHSDVSLSQPELEVPYFVKIWANSSDEYVLSISSRASVFGDLSSFDHSKMLSPSFVLHWMVTSTDIRLGLEVHALGWAGFGLGESASGSMPGADMVVVEAKKGQAFASDHFATRKARPPLDPQQDWRLESFQQVGGHSFFEVTRALDTGDAEYDRPIVTGPTRVVFAFGEGPFTYHGGHRGADVVTFIPSSQPPPRLPEDILNVSLYFDGFLVPEQQTTYACQSYELPSDRDYHVVKISPHVHPATKAVLHHFIAYVCDEPSAKYDSFRSPTECQGTGCSKMMYAWGAGQGDLVYPPQAGTRIGKTGIKYLVLEIHFDNVDRVPGLKDFSGLDFFFTPTLRQHDAGIMAFGDPYVRNPDEIPGGASCNHLEYTCPSQCTEQWSHDITVFGDFLHMHDIGSQIWSTVHRKGQKALSLNRADYFDGAFQSVVRMGTTGPNTAGPGFVLKRGDRIHTHCIFTNPSSHAVRFASRSVDEMCIEFLLYYPTLSTPERDYAVCSYYQNGRNNCTICGNMDAYSSFCDFRLPNPIARDPLGGSVRSFANASDHRGCPLHPPPPQDMLVDDAILLSLGSPLPEPRLAFVLLLCIVAVLSQ